MYAYLSIPLAYLIGSISSTYIVSRLLYSHDPRSADDGRISAAAIYRSLGLGPFAITVILDIGLAASAVIAAKALTDAIEVHLLAGVATVAGHNWSLMLKFKGGLGATAIAGALFALVPLPLCGGLAVGGPLYYFTRRAGLSTLVTLLLTSSILFILNKPAYLAAYPVTLLIVMVIKRWQVDGASKLVHWDN